MAFEYEVLDKDFNKAVREATKKVESLRVPFTQIIASWFKSNQYIFQGKPGKYEDLAESTKEAKIRKYGFAYPVLVESGLLRDSITVPGHPKSNATIVNNKTMVLGTKAKGKKGFDYPYALQYGTSKMPARQWLLLGGEQVSGPLNNRKEAWLQIIREYVEMVTKEEFTSNG